MNIENVIKGLAILKRYVEPETELEIDCFDTVNITYSELKKPLKLADAKQLEELGFQSTGATIYFANKDWDASWTSCWNFKVGRKLVDHECLADY